jgi:iron complex outermembrane receptor protein
MNSKAICRAALLASCPFFAVQPAFAQDEPVASENDAILTDTIVVTAPRGEPELQEGIEPPAQIAWPADAAAIAARTAGGGLVGNGALSGQLSYRGLAGQRVVGRVNGQRFATGGPNAMDPPLHYAPSILVEQIEIARGVAPVSQGPSLAGAVNARLVETEFTDSPAVSAQGRFASQYRSVDESYALGGLIGLASDRWRLGVITSREEGDDYQFAGGTAVGTSFERNLYGAHAGFRTGPGELFIEYRRSETDPSGNPPFALDIVYFNTDFMQGGFKGQIAQDIALDMRMGHVAVRHLMDNQTTREPAASPMLARATFADADTSTAEASLRFGSAHAYLQIGADAELTDKFVRITNPNNAAFFIDAQPNLQSERLGAFAQWRGAVSAVEFELGARIDQTDQSAGIPQLGAAVPMGPRSLAAAFIAADREHSTTTIDAVLRAWLPLKAITPRVTLARKERVPSLLERFGWLPTEASFGLADGNIYVGNLALEPETAWIAEFGFDLEHNGLSLRPTLFYRRVDNFIQGVPFDATIGVVDTPVEMIAAMNGDSTPLRFGNVDAELYGVDLDFSLRPVERIELSGTASYVRGKRRDIADNLYRPAPPNLRMSAAWLGDRLTLGAELILAADQDRVSASNDEQPSDGYTVVGLFGRYAISERLEIEAGIENLLDTEYQPHLAGRNRVGASDVPVGERLPGAGQSGWLRLNARF